jgi:hypothetical protein
MVHTRRHLHTTPLSTRARFTRTHLTQVHNNRLVNFLPQVSSEYLNQRDLKCRNFTVHKYAGQIQLDLETNVDVGAIYRR